MIAIKMKVIIHIILNLTTNKHDDFTIPSVLCMYWKVTWKDLQLKVRTMPLLPDLDLIVALRFLLEYLGQYLPRFSSKSFETEKASPCMTHGMLS